MSTSCSARPLGIECRADDAELLAELGKLTDSFTWQEAHAERAFLVAMDGGCQVPIAGYATSNGEEITLTGLVVAQMHLLYIRKQ